MSFNISQVQVDFEVSYLFIILYFIINLLYLPLLRYDSSLKTYPSYVFLVLVIKFTIPELLMTMMIMT